MSRRRLVAGNWKMHGSAAHADAFMQTLAEADLPAGVELLVCPPFPYLAQMLRLAAGTPVAIGAQNLCAETGPGAFTGEVGGPMLADIGCSYVIVGHSERRALYGENNDTVTAKFAAAQAAGLTPILCVGESLAEREAGTTEEVLRAQLGCVLADRGVAAFANAVLAYEPVWAIGTGRSASPEQAQAVHAFLRARIADEDATIAAGVRIVYGGSVKPDNAAGVFGGADVDGGLVGGASLEATPYLAISSAG